MSTPDPGDRPAVLMVNSIKFWGGGEQWFLQVAMGLRARGWEVAVAGRQGGEFLTRVAEAGIPTLPAAMRSDFGIGDILSMRRWIKSRASVLVLCNLTRDVRLTTLATLGIRDVRVLWIMGSILIRERRRDRFWVRRRVDRIVVPSRALAAELTALSYMTPDLVTVVPIGLDLDRWPQPTMLPSSASSSTQVPIVGAFGRLEPRKGQEFLLQAWPDVLSRFPSAQLWIVGTGSDEARLRSIASTLGIEASVKLWGFRRDVREILESVSVVVQPSLYEPFGIALLEAMASGKPVVCTTAGGMPEVVTRECACLVPPGDTASLAEAIMEILADTELQRRMGEAGRNHVEENFSLPRMIDRVESVIQELGLSRT